MFKTDHKKVQATSNKASGQAAIELAVFGAILIFLLGTIVRTAVGNSYQQNQNFQAMRIAMLESWKESESNPGPNMQVTSRNSPSVLFIEDRLSPDYNKFGDLDRNPFIASGGGSFSYNMLYPLSITADVENSLPIMDVYINGLHFPFTMASYVTDKAFVHPPSPQECMSKPSTCEQNQCFRDMREWGGGIVHESSFKVADPPVADTTVLTGDCAPTAGALPTSAERECQLANNACAIFAGLATAGILNSLTIVPLTHCSTTTTGVINPIFVGTGVPIKTSPQWQSFVSGGAYSYTSLFPNYSASAYKIFLSNILKIVQAEGHEYKLLYTVAANPGGTASLEPAFSTIPPACPGCRNKGLSYNMPLLDYSGNPTTDGNGKPTNVNADLQYDFLRLGYFTSAQKGASGSNGPSAPPCASLVILPCQPVEGSFPIGSPLRQYMAWQWAASAAVSAEAIGINTTNNQYPTYDIDGRLKEVTIFAFWGDTNDVIHIAYEDSQGGDIDQSWDINSCGTKPGLQTPSQVYTFTENGTYLLIKEGKIYNPETGTVVRSANKRDSVDLVQRTVKLSNNTGRFCTTTSPVTFGKLGLPVSQGGKNPVEVCVDESAPNFCTCFMGGTVSAPQSPCGFTMAETCYDTSPLVNSIFVRSRNQDRRGRFWMTNASGQLKVQP